MVPPTDSQRSIKRSGEFTGVFKKNSCGIFMGLGVTQFRRTSWGESLFSPEFVRVK